MHSAPSRVAPSVVVALSPFGEFERGGEESRALLAVRLVEPVGLEDDVRRLDVLRHREVLHRVGRLRADAYLERAEAVAVVLIQRIEYCHN